MPKVLRIINRLNLGGPTYNVAYLSKFLAPEFDTTIVSGRKLDTEQSSSHIITDLGLKARYVPDMKRSLSPMADSIALRKLRNIIRDVKPDIVHTHAAKAGTLGRIAAMQCKVPVVVHTFHGHTFHSYFNGVKTRAFLQIERTLARASSAIVAISDIQKRELTETYKICAPDKVHVIPLGFELDNFQEDVTGKRSRFREMFRLREDEIAIGIIGRIVPVKNHEMFIRSLARVLAKCPQRVRAFVIGDGEDRQRIEDLASNLNIPFTIGCPPDEAQPLTFTSWMHNIDEVNAGLDIVALTSLNEGTPVSLIEAQAANRPIVATRVGGIEDVVRVGETALLSDVNDVDGFSDNLLRMIESKTGVTYLKADTGFNFVRERFHYSRLVADTRQLYRELLEKA